MFEQDRFVYIAPHATWLQRRWFATEEPSFFLAPADWWLQAVADEFDAAYGPWLLAQHAEEEP